MNIQRNKGHNLYFKSKSCKSKMAYTTIEELKKGAERLSYKFGGAIDIHGYACRFCGKYHLTTSERNFGGKYDDRIF